MNYSLRVIIAKSMEILWSNEKIDLRHPGESKFRDSFEAYEWIWGRFYLSQSMKNSIYNETGVEYNSFYFHYDLAVIFQAGSISANLYLRKRMSLK